MLANIVSEIMNFNVIMVKSKDRPFPRQTLHTVVAASVETCVDDITESVNVSLCP